MQKQKGIQKRRPTKVAYRPTGEKTTRKKRTVDRIDDESSTEKDGECSRGGGADQGPPKRLKLQDEPVVRPPKYVAGRPLLTPFSPSFRACDHCAQTGDLCLVLRSGRYSACIKCHSRKRQCNIINTVKRMVASGQLGSLEDAYTDVSTVRDVQALGLDRAGEHVLSQVVSLKQSVLSVLLDIDKRLKSVEQLLRRTGGGNAVPAQPLAKGGIEMEEEGSADDEVSVGDYKDLPETDYEEKLFTEDDSDERLFLGLGVHR